MKFRRQPREALNVNLTPLIDVVFLLLIFFMVSTTFTRETQLAVDLPEATGLARDEVDEQIEILIDERGQFRVNGRALVDGRMRTLQAAMYEIAQGDTTLPLVISADAEAPHQYVVRAMDAAGQMGFSRLSIASVQPADTP
ncbi:MAG: biopolymer transporter ExbD [Halieaceae bacterium]|jgi:biopolymer transport protein ExbD|nr:biopolymer transporter ExbD [Halieaceae bacterium]